MPVFKVFRLLARSVVIIFFLQTSVNAGNWNSGGGSDGVDATLSDCMAAGLRNFDAVMSYNPELFVKLMGKEAILPGFNPETPRQRLFVKLASQYDRPMTQEDKAAMLKMMTPNCNYSRLKSAGSVYRLIAEIAERQEKVLRGSLSRDVTLTYAAATELMVGSAQIDIQRMISKVSEREMEEFVRRFERFSKNSNFNAEVQNFTNRMAEVFASYDMEFKP